MMNYVSDNLTCTVAPHLLRCFVSIKKYLIFPFQIALIKQKIPKMFLHNSHTDTLSKHLCYLDNLITLSLSKFTICYKCKRAQIPNFTFAVISTHCNTIRAFKFFFCQKKILLALLAWQVDS